MWSQVISWHPNNRVPRNILKTIEKRKWSCWRYCMYDKLDLILLHDNYHNEVLFQITFGYLRHVCRNKYVNIKFKRILYFNERPPWLSRWQRTAYSKALEHHLPFDSYIDAYMLCIIYYTIHINNNDDNNDTTT